MVSVSKIFKYKTKDSINEEIKKEIIIRMEKANKEYGRMLKSAYNLGTARKIRSKIGIGKDHDELIERASEGSCFEDIKYNNDIVEVYIADFFIEQLKNNKVISVLNTVKMFDPLKSIDKNIVSEFKDLGIKLEKVSENGN